MFLPGLAIHTAMGNFLLVIIELSSLGAFVLSQFTRLTDGRTDRRTDAHRRDRVCIQCSAVKMKKKLWGET